MNGKIVHNEQTGIAHSVVHYFKMEIIITHLINNEIIIIAAGLEVIHFQYLIIIFYILAVRLKAIYKNIYGILIPEGLSEIWKHLLNIV